MKDQKFSCKIGGCKLDINETISNNRGKKSYSFFKKNISDIFRDIIY